MKEEVPEGPAVHSASQNFGRNKIDPPHHLSAARSYHLFAVQVEVECCVDSTNRKC